MAKFNLFEDSEEINALRAACRTEIHDSISGEVGFSCASNLLSKKFGKFVLQPKSCYSMDFLTFLICILNCSHISTNDSPRNSPPLSKNTVLRAPKIAVQCFINILAVIVLVYIIVAALYLVNSSTICIYHNFGFSRCKSIDTVKLKSSAFDSPAMGQGLGFLNLIQVVQLFTTSFIKADNSGFSKLAFRINFSIFSTEACPNCL